MQKIIHCADLHLSGEEKEYSLSVLDEIIRLTQSHHAAHLILAGDIFDTFDQVELLRQEFRTRMQSLGSHCKVLFLPGNHEYLKRSGKSLRNLNIGPVILLDETPFSIWTDSDIEFLAIPHRSDYSDYQNWEVPAKQKKMRIAIAHAIVAGMSFTGTGEIGGTAIDPGIFPEFSVDYVALGHIHSQKQSVYNSLLFAYPGSARVWRKGETGQRGVYLVTIDASVKLQFLPLESAGMFREYTVPLSLEGDAENVFMNAETWGENDWIALALTGIIEDEHKLADSIAYLRKVAGSRVRKFDIDAEKVAILPGIASQPLVRKFLDAWQAREPEPQNQHARTAWLKARELALNELKILIETRSGFN